jgi:hypothetical protein
VRPVARAGDRAASAAGRQARSQQRSGRLRRNPQVRRQKPPRQGPGAGTTDGPRANPATLGPRPAGHWKTSGSTLRSLARRRNGSTGGHGTRRDRRISRANGFHQ